MAQRKIVAAGPQLQKVLKDLSNGVKNVDLTANQSIAPRQEVRSSIPQTSVYDGPLAVRFDGETFSVVDGGDPDSGIAGYFYVNGAVKTAHTATGISPKEGWLCIKGGNVSSTGAFEIIDTIPSKPDGGGNDYHPLARIKKNGTSWSFRQITGWQLPQLWVFEDCESES